MNMSNIFAGILLNELSTDKLAKYKTAASADATKSDQEGDFKRGDKRFSGIVKATNKQFANDAKKVKLPEAGAQSAIDTASDATSLAQNALMPAMAAQTVGGAAKVLGKTSVATGAAKLAANLGGRLIPGMGAAVSGVSAAHRANLGDYTGAAIDAAAGGASFLPVGGTLGTLAGIGTNLVRDRYNTGSFFPTDEEMQAAYSKEPVTQAAKSATPAPAAAPVAAPSPAAAKSATPAPAAAPVAALSPAAATKARADFAANDPRKAAISAAPVAKATAPVANTKGSWQEIYNLNKTIIGANPNLIKPGQKLTLPNGTVYTVKPGDSLSKIAAQSVQESIYMQYDKVPSSIMYGLLEASQQSSSQFTKVDPASAKIDIPRGRGMSPLEWLASLSNNPAVKGDVEPATSNKVVVVGDSLAVGTGSQISGAIVDAKVGINSSAVLYKVTNDNQLKGADVAIISAGANDGAGKNGKNPDSAKTIANLKGIRNALGAKKYVWILPYNRSVAQDIMSIAGSDEVIDLAKTTEPSKDGIHPSSYAPVAKDAIKKGGVSPAPATTPNKSSPGGGTIDTRTGKQRGAKNFVNPNNMMRYLSGQGLDKNSIAGLLANARAESSFNSGAYIKSDAGQGQGGGLFGFHDPKDGRGEFTNMVNSCGADWQSNWQGQLDYALQASRYPKTGFKSPGAAASWFVTNYERPKYPARAIAVRSADAANYA